MELENLILSGVSQKEKDKYHMKSFIFEIEYMAQTNLSSEKKQTYGHRKQTCGCQGGGRGSGMDWEFGVNGCKSLPLEWISSEILLYSTGNYVWSLMMEHDNVRKNVYMYVWLGHLAVQ